MSVTRITLDGEDITDLVIFGTATFVARVNGQVGTAFIRYRDDGRDYVPITGKRLTCEIDGDLKWSGFAMQITKAYSFSAEDTSIGPRVWDLYGMDDNLLFDKRIIFDPEDPEHHIDFTYDAGSWDDDIVKDIFNNYLDLEDDAITDAGVTRVARAILDIPGVISKKGTSKTIADWESTTYTGTIASAGYTWGQAMDVIQRATGAVYYIDSLTDPDHRILRYVDVETATSALGLSDTPGTDTPGPTGPPTLGVIDGLSIVSPGTGWIAGGLFIIINNGTDWNAYGTIDTVDGGGAVLTFHLDVFGSGYVVGTGDGNPLGGPGGSGLVFNIDSVITVPGEAGPSTPNAGYREFSLIENGTHLTNDMHVWGAALGVKKMVHSRHQDSGSITDHGRWVDGLFTNGLYKQASANLVSASYVNGTPQSLRGRKNDQVTFHCRTFEPGFSVGSVVPVTNTIFGFSDNLPLREMTITWAAPWIAIFDLVLGHEIDQPWSFYESLRKMPRPYEIAPTHMIFPQPPSRLPYCPLPSLLDTGMQSIFQRDFGGLSNDPDAPIPLWQNPPYGGVHLGNWTGSPGDPSYRGLDATLPPDPDDPTLYGFIGPFAAATTIELKSPASGAIEVLAAFDPGDGDLNNVVLGSIIADSGSLQFSVVQVDGRDALHLQMVTWFTGVETVSSPPGPVFFRTGVSPSPVTIIPDWPHVHEPLWVRFLNDPGTGRLYAKVWPRRKNEPIDWQAVEPNSSAVTLEVTFTSNGNFHSTYAGGFEAISIFAAAAGSFLDWGNAGGISSVHSGSWGPLDNIDGNGAVISYGFDPPTSPYYFFFPTAPGPFPSRSFVNNPSHGTGFSWAHFTGTDPWDPATMLMQNGYGQAIASRGAKNYEPADIGFTQNNPDFIRISGELSVEDVGLQTVPGTNLLGFPVTVGLHGYSFGAGDPSYDSSGAVPTTTSYVYVPAMSDWVPFSFVIPGDHFQWGVSMITGTLSLMRDWFSSEPPGGPSQLPTSTFTGSIYISTRSVRYEASYTTEEIPDYFCIPVPLHQLDGDAVGFPAYDKGDHQTYTLGSVFAAGSTTVWVNGLVQRYGEDEDYVETPAEGEIVFNGPLDPDDEVIVDFAGIGAVLP